MTESLFIGSRNNPEIKKLKKLVSDLEARIEQLEKEKEQVLDENAKWKADFEALQNELIKVRQEKELLEGRIKTLEADIDALKRAQIQTEADARSAKEESHKSVKALATNTVELQKTQRKLDNLKKQMDAQGSKYDGEILEREEQIENLSRKYDALSSSSRHQQKELSNSSRLQLQEASQFTTEGAQIIIRKLATAFQQKILEDAFPNCSAEGIYSLNDLTKWVKQNPDLDAAKKWKKISQDYNIDRVFLATLREIISAGNIIAHEYNKEDISKAKQAIKYYSTATHTNILAVIDAIEKRLG